MVDVAAHAPRRRRTGKKGNERLIGHPQRWDEDLERHSGAERTMAGVTPATIIRVVGGVEHLVGRAAAR
jgi:hypothetical protein